MKHPMQTFVQDGLGIVRFHQNSIVRRLLDQSMDNGFGLNELSEEVFPQEDWIQFYQLIGYSLTGFHELNKVSDEVALEASKAAQEQGFTEASGCRDHGCPMHCEEQNQCP